ncbi:MAG TPA: histidine phosphatase family protein [Spirochaetota bacterium]|nr:histidine phosphatase family protein [Spirochaetota bacterium]HPQ55084.1 histidine phosphatase family protein [Spirochaetota bacterium]
MRLIITRHGETEENNAGIIQGHFPGHLSEAGIEQAGKVALRLKDEKIDFIYSSDLARAADTAAEIAKYHPGVPVILVHDLREIFLGAWQGKTREELGFEKNAGVSGFFPEDGESSEALFQRADRFLHEVLLRHPGDTVLLAGHNVINKAIIAVITGKGPDEIHSIENQHNTAVSIFDIDEDRNYTIRVYNCVKHVAEKKK